MKRCIYLLLLLIISKANAQENINYQKPSSEILELVDVSLAPSVLIDENKDFLILRYRDAFKTIAELSEEELRLGGLRINPKTNIGSRTNYYNNLKLIKLKSKNLVAQQIAGLPENPRLANFSWSPDQKKIAFTNTTNKGVELWVLNLQNLSSKKISNAKVNANMHDVINWFEDSKSLLVKMVSEDRRELIDTENSIPTGPTISINEGSKAQNRTYQDLLKNKNDEYNFEQLALSDLYKISIDGSQEKWLDGAMYEGISFSPDGNYVMITTIEKPFSYLVPYGRFPSKTNIYSSTGKMIQTVLEVPLIEELPKGFMAERTGRRDLSWRDDKPASLIL
ncbi:hypothetical protein [Labilibaculum sp.]|uniref:hypothetical protein n=1 Tax=Labilibaculum sp. TaxID=2060723 RepID=UPI003568C68D